MTIAETLHRTTTTLAESAIPDPSLEAECLLAHALGTDRVGLYLRLKERLTPSQADSFEELMACRLARQPMAYIMRQRQFFGIELYVDGRVLIPRPETELLVEKAVQIAGRSLPRRGANLRIADIGTGSGAIAIALALSLPQSQVYATDISVAALDVATINCGRHHVTDRVHLLQGDLLQPLPCPVDMIVANLPYVADLDMQSLAPEVSLFEPQLALAGGNNGLVLIRRLLADVTSRLAPAGWLLLEVGLGQAATVVEDVKHHLPASDVSVAPDLAGIDRAVIVHLK